MRNYAKDQNKLDKEFAEECKEIMNHVGSLLPARVASGTLKVSDEPLHLPPLVAEKSILVCDD